MHGFTVQNWKAELAGFLPEDAFAFDEEKGIACVADGVTRDFCDGTVLTHDIKGLLRVFRGDYIRYAADISKIAVNTFMLDRSLEMVNREIEDYNFQVGLFPTDYLGRDFAGCTFASASLIRRNPESDSVEIQTRYVADAGFAVVDRDGNLAGNSPDEGPHSAEKNPQLEKILAAHGGWTSKTGRRIIRELYRNNPSEPLAYGVLTGEESALSYIGKRTIKVSRGDCVLLFTDGMKDLLFSYDREETAPDGDNFVSVHEKYLDLIMSGEHKRLEKLCRKNIHTEGTLVVWRIE